MKPHRTRTGYAWIGICAAVGVSIALVVFIAQNSQPVRVSFLAWHGRFPLAVALLAAAACTGVTAGGIGSARILQLRRASRRVPQLGPSALDPDTGPRHDTVEIPAIDTAHSQDDPALRALT